LPDKMQSRMFFATFKAGAQAVRQTAGQIAFEIICISFRSDFTRTFVSRVYALIADEPSALRHLYYFYIYSPFSPSVIFPVTLFFEFSLAMA
jgi:hypothetical protein